PHPLPQPGINSRWLYTPAVRSSRERARDVRQLSASPQASPLLSQEILQGGIAQHGVRQQPLEPRDRGKPKWQLRCIKNGSWHHFSLPHRRILSCSLSTAS